MIPALVLTAGHATRLRPLSLVRAKGALPVAGVPLVTRILQWLAANGVSDAVLNLHHLPHTLTGAVGDGSAAGVRVRYSWEVPVLGSAGGPRRALRILGAPRFLIVNGDTLTDLPLAPLIAAHERSGALVTIAGVPNREPRKYSGLAATADGAFTHVIPRGSTEPSLHFFGVQVVEAAAFASVPDDTPYETIGALYPALAAERPGSVRVFAATAAYLDIGTPSDYLDTSLEVAAREGTAAIAASAAVDPSARIERSVLWDDVVVEAGAMLRECVVTDAARIPEDTSWHGVTLRRAGGELAPGERRIGDLAVCPLPAE
jgi:NDP-sugar pyrophosphorylase family protein